MAAQGLSELSIRCPKCPSISQVVVFVTTSPSNEVVHLFHQVFTKFHEYGDIMWYQPTWDSEKSKPGEFKGEASPSVPFPCPHARLEMPEMVSGCKNHGCHWVYRHEVSTMDLCGFISCMRYHLSLMSPGLGTWCFGHTQSSTWCASMFSGQDVGVLRDKVVAAIQNGCDYSDTEIRLPQ